MGFFGFALATTVAGEVVVPPSVGLETVSGKSLEPLGSGGVHIEVGGVHAAGAGYVLLDGLQVIATGGVEGYVDCVGGGLFAVVALFTPPVPQADTRIVNTNNSMVTVDLLKNLPTHSGTRQNPRISGTPQVVDGDRLRRAGRKPDNRRANSQLSAKNVFELLKRGTYCSYRKVIGVNT